MGRILILIFFTIAKDQTRGILMHLALHYYGREMSKEGEIDNHRILIATTLLFFIFVIAEFVGAAFSHSLSLFGDASAMSVDVGNIFALGLAIFTMC